MGTYTESPFMENNTLVPDGTTRTSQKYLRQDKGFLISHFKETHSVSWIRQTWVTVKPILAVHFMLSRQLVVPKYSCQK